MDESDLRQEKVVFRDFDPATDNAMIYSTWRNNSFYSAAEKPKIKEKTFFKQKNKQIKDLLEVSHVRIACLQSDPTSIIGYSVSANTHLYWIYIKFDYRNNNIAAMLAPRVIESVPGREDLTKIGLEIAQKKKYVIQGEEYGRTEDRQTH